MEESTSRFVWRDQVVCGHDFTLPGAIRSVVKGPSKIKYWRLSIRIDGVDYIYTYRIWESEVPPLIEALGSLVLLIHAFGLPSRLLSRRSGKKDPTLPLGISGPYTENKEQLYLVSIPGQGRRNKGLRVFIQNGDTATALEEAKRLRAAAVTAYRAAAQVEADQVIARIWQLVEALDEL